MNDESLEPTDAETVSTTGLAAPLPEYNAVAGWMQNSDVEVVHELVTQSIPSRATDVVTSDAAKFTPNNDSPNPPDVAPLPENNELIVGASNEITDSAVVAIEAMVIVLRSAVAGPLIGGAQVILVALFHDVLWQTVLPSLAVGVRSSSAKLSPTIVIDVPPVEGAFGAAMCVEDGASNVKSSSALPTTPPIVTIPPKDRPKEPAVLQVRYVLVCH